MVTDEPSSVAVSEIKYYKLCLLVHQSELGSRKLELGATQFFYYYVEIYKYLNQYGVYPKLMIIFLIFFTMEFIFFKENNR